MDVNEPRKLRVFIADDSHEVRLRLVGRIAALPGVEVVGCAKDGIGALQSISRLKPDLVLLDMRMPRCSGLEVLAALNELMPRPEVVMLSDFPYPHYREQSLAAGAQHFLDKEIAYEVAPELCRQLRARLEADSSATSPADGAVPAGAPCAAHRGFEL